MPTRPQSKPSTRAPNSPSLAHPSRAPLNPRLCKALSDKERGLRRGKEKRGSTPAAPQCGFTLIEMMLAIGVLALILAMLSTSFSTVAHSKVHAEGRLLVD